MSIIQDLQNDIKGIKGLGKTWIVNNARHLQDNECVIESVGSISQLMTVDNFFSEEQIEKLIKDNELEKRMKEDFCAPIHLHVLAEKLHKTYPVQNGTKAQKSADCLADLDWVNNKLKFVKNGYQEKDERSGKMVETVEFDREAIKKLKDVKANFKTVCIELGKKLDALSQNTKNSDGSKELGEEVSTLYSEYNILDIGNAIEECQQIVMACIKSLAKRN